MLDGFSYVELGEIETALYARLQKLEEHHNWAVALPDDYKGDLGDYDTKAYWMESAEEQLTRCKAVLQKVESLRKGY